MDFILWVVLGVLIGALVVWGWARARIAWLQAQASQQAAQVSRLESEKNTLQHELAAVKKELVELTEKSAKLHAQLEEREAKYQDSLKVYENQVKEFQHQRENLDQELDKLRRDLQELQQKYIAAEERSKTTQERLVDTQKRLEEAVSASQSLQEQLMKEQEVRATAEANLSSTRALLEEREKMIQQLKVEFENLAGELLQRTQDRLQQQGAQSIQVLLEPFRRDLQALSTRINEQQNVTSQLEGQIKELSNQSQKLATQSQQISEQARQLAEALRGDIRLQGQLGEIVLERVLQWAGLREDIHYRKQESAPNEAGKHQRPDFIVYLPGASENGKEIVRKLVIDSKLSLVNYERYFHAQSNPQEQEKHAKALLRDIREHIKTLSEKAYHTNAALSSFDFVVMFVGLEGALHLALQQDQNLLEEALKRHIIIATPSTLVSILNIVHILHDMHKQRMNTNKVIELATEIYNKIAQFLEYLEKVGRALDQAGAAYKDAVKQLKAGQGNAISLLEEMREEGGLHPKNQLPKKIRLEAQQENLHTLSLPPSDSVGQ